jgi:ATP-binding protein involved in chromosome partitioning
VRSVEIDGAVVTVVVALTVAGCPLKKEITDRVTAAVKALPEVDDVRVDLTTMSPEQLAALRERFGRHDHGPQVWKASAQPLGGSGRGISSATRVVGMTSGKGGVGKSSVTVNVAVALRQLGYDVAVLDADVYGFSIPAMLGIEEEPVVTDGMIIPPAGHGVRCISIGFFLDDARPVMWRGPMLHTALRQFVSDVQWGSPDFLLVDMPPGTGDVAMSMGEYLPHAELYVITTPQPAAQRVAQRSGSFARELRLPLGGVIENMSWFTCDDGKRHEIFGSGGGAALAETLGIPLVGQIPLVTDLRTGGDIGMPIVLSQPASEAASAFLDLAKSVAATRKRRVYSPELKVV